MGQCRSQGSSRSSSREITFQDDATFSPVNGSLPVRKQNAAPQTECISAAPLHRSCSILKSEGDQRVQSATHLSTSMIVSEQCICDWENLQMSPPIKSRERYFSCELDAVPFRSPSKSLSMLVPAAAKQGGGENFSSAMNAGIHSYNSSVSFSTRYASNISGLTTQLSLKDNHTKAAAAAATKGQKIARNNSFNLPISSMNSIIVFPSSPKISSSTASFEVVSIASSSVSQTTRSQLHLHAQGAFSPVRKSSTSNINHSGGQRVRKCSIRKPSLRLAEIHLSQRDPQLQDLMNRIPLEQLSQLEVADLCETLVLHKQLELSDQEFCGFLQELAASLFKLKLPEVGKKYFELLITEKGKASHQTILKIIQSQRRY